MNSAVHFVNPYGCVAMLKNGKVLPVNRSNFVTALKYLGHLEVPFAAALCRLDDPLSAIRHIGANAKIATMRLTFMQSLSSPV
jgi:hypothetical protein